MNAGASGLSAAVRLVPRDAGTVLEVVADGAPGAADRLRRWNPDVRVHTVPLAAGAPEDPALAGAGPFDAIVLDAGWTALPHPAELLRRLRLLLAEGAPLLAVVPDAEPGARQALVPVFEGAGLRLDLGHAVPAPPEGPASGLAVVRAVDAARPLWRLLVHNLANYPSVAVNDKRVLEPADFLATLPGVRVRTEVKTGTPLAFAGDRLFVIQRSLNTPDQIPAYNRLVHKHGYLLVSEFDDHPSRWDLAARHDHLSFRMVHAVQTSTVPLAEELRPFNPALAVFPNCMAELPPERPVRPGNPVTLFFGAVNREADWVSLMPALERLVAAFGDALRFEVVHDRAFFDALPTTRKAFTPTCAYDTYLDVLGRCDIALLPLSDTLFNRCKSDLKFVECAAHGVVALASPVVYGNSLRDGETGVLFDGPERFEEALRSLIEAPERRRALAAAARGWVARHRLLARHFRARHAWYRDLFVRRTALEAARVANLERFGVAS